MQTMRECIGRSNRRVVYGLAAIAASLLAGCMANLGDVLARHEAEREALAKTTADRMTASASCCANYRSIKFQPMPLGVEQEVVLSASSPVFDFPFGRSRFEAFELPPLMIGERLRIKAIELISGPTAKPIYRPALVLLSENFEPIEVRPSLAFEHRFSGWDVEGHEADLAIDAARARARYLIVAADPAVVGGAYLRRAHSTVIPAGGTYVSTAVPDQRFPYGYEGRSLVELVSH